MTQINKHISEENFQRYLKNQMTSAERHLFEREMQKHPFEMEAMEGFQNIDPEQIQKDLDVLKTKINTKKQKYYYRYWAAAASFLLIVTSGLIWFQLSEKSPIPEIAEYKTEQKQEGNQVATDLHKEIIPEQKILQPQLSEENIKIEPKEKRGKTNIVSQPKKSKGILKSETINPIEIAENKTELITKNVIENDISIDEFRVEPTQNARAVRGIAQPKDSNFLLIVDGAQKVNNIQPAPAKKVSYKKVRTAEDFSDSFAAAPIGEVLTETDSNKSNAKLHFENLTDSKVHPEIGMPEYKKYLKNKAILNPDYTKRKEVVKLLIKFNTRGEIIEFQNQNKTDSLFFEKAKNIILTGPKWKPEIKNGIPIESETKIKIIFRREK
jgi:hypothetical protein